MWLCVLQKMYVSLDKSGCQHYLMQLVQEQNIFYT